MSNRLKLVLFSHVALFSVGAYALQLQDLGRVGLLGGDYVDGSGGQNSFPKPSINDDGVVTGLSTNFTTNNSVPWIATTGGATHRVGFYDTPHTDVQTGDQSGDIGEPLAGGLAQGHSDRYIFWQLIGEPRGLNGRTLWVADPSGVTQPVGLYSGVHREPSEQGAFSAILGAVTPSGFSGGYSVRYSTSTLDYSDVINGRSAWLADSSGNTDQVGIYGPVNEYAKDNSTGSRVDLYFYSDLTAPANDDGYAAGYSTRFLDTVSEKGQAAWVARLDAGSATTTRVGFFDADHTRGGDGRQFSETTGGVNADGKVAGYSTRYLSNNQPGGKSAWIADASGALRIGLTGVGFETSTGVETSSPAAGITEDGLVAGTSVRYGASDEFLGSAAWRADELGVTIPLGLTDSEHTSSAGRQDNSVDGIGESGMVAGRAVRYDGGASSLGFSTWLADPAGVSRRVGFDDDDHTGAGGLQWSEFLSDPTPSGHIVGESLRYNSGSSTATGSSLWVASEDGTTHRIGIFSSPYARLTYADVSVTDGITPGGYIPGESARLLDSSDAGTVAWVADTSGKTVAAVIADAVHASGNSLIQNSELEGITESGFAWGNVTRYNGDETEEGQTAFVLDVDNENLIPIVLSVRESDNYAYAQIKAVSEEGIAVGTYTRFDESGNTIGLRVFVWDRFGGAQDLGDALGNGSGAWWDTLLSAEAVNNGRIVVRARDSATDRGVFVAEASAVAGPPAFLREPWPVTIARAGEPLEIPFKVGDPLGGVVSVSVVGTLPPGLSLIDDGGGAWRIVGTVLEGDAGLYSIGVQISNGSGSVTRDLTLQVIVPASPPAPRAPGGLVAWGSGSQGGDASAVANQLREGVVNVFSTDSAFAALKSDGSVVVWGNANSGGDASSVAGGLSSGVVAISSTRSAFAALKSDGSVLTWGSTGGGGDSSAVSADLASGVSRVFAGAYAFAALKSDGSLVTWGSASSGGDSTAVAAQLSADVKEVFAAGSAFAALKDDGSLVTWGSTTRGGDSSDVSGALLSGVITVVGNDYGFAALREDGSVVLWGLLQNPSLQVAVELQQGVVDLVANQTAFAAITPGGKVLAWGSTTNGGSTSNASGDLSSDVVEVHPVRSGAFAARKSDGSVVTWGSSSYGGNSTAVSADLASGVEAFASSWFSIAARKSDGSVVTWGSSIYGGDSSAVAADLASGVGQVFATNWGGYAALKSDGSVVTWGSSSAGGDSTSVAGRIGADVDWVYSGGRAFAAIGSFVFLPDITVEYPAGTALASGDGVSFGPVALGTSREISLTIRNTGESDLTGLSVTKSGTNASEFSLGTLASAVLEEGGSMSLAVTFDPLAEGERTAAIQILSNDPDTPSFEILLSGSSGDFTALLDAAIFDAGLTGPDADPSATPFDDGVPNILKYAFNMDLAGPDSSAMAPGGSSGVPGGALVEENGQTYWRVEYVVRKGSGLVYAPKKTSDLGQSFVPMSATPQVESIDGQWDRYIVNEPCDPATESQCFSHVEVTLP